MDKYTYEVGKYLGYPECCIKWFSEERIEKHPSEHIPLTQEQKAVHGYRGFIPCPDCAAKVTEETLPTLIKDRQSPHPFPDDNENFSKRFKEYFGKITQL